ncbi:membrane dipeptidase [Paracoccus sp. TK19116]|uniref:Membrane dipeptidase n=1 Tax=Paracoccus albicereus TaxID=2922394 RepID=A0ABT1MWD8_9RHOB|nr:membrane dipeptidase [Paracoccus albicereus]MCQ0971658.1 membrane dipeptidase [Paracoccus albicereus]
MLRRILGGLAIVIVVLIGAVLVWGPGYVEAQRNPVTGPDDGWPVSERAQALHDRLLIGDWHADALLWDRDLLDRADRGHTDIPRLAEGNVAVQVFTTVTKSPRGQNYGENSEDAPDNITPLFIGQLRPVRAWTSLRERALVQAAALHRMAEDAPDRLRLILTRADLEAVLADHRAGGRLVGGILGSEGGHPLEGDIANLDTLYDAGFRLIGLTHFFDNELGGSLHGEDDTGLSDFGRTVVTEMMARNMIVDLAHASPQMVRDVLAMEGTRPIVSHTGIHRHCASPRNLPDDLMQAVAAKGGLIGIGFWSDVICGKTPDDIATAITAAIALVGEDHVSLGSDYDGSVDAPFDAAHLAALTQALIDAGLTDPQIAKVMGGNMMAFLAEMLPK